MKKIFYLGYYDTTVNKSEKRNIVLAATNKMTYIVSALEDCGYTVNLISASSTRNNKKYPAKIVKIGKQSLLHLPKTLQWGNKVRRVISIYYSKCRLLKDLLKFLNKGDTLIVYHSVAYASIVMLVKKIRKIKLVLEVEEIYSDVNEKKSDRSKEFKIFDAADAYIFPTALLNEKLNKKGKEYSIIHGTYQVEKELMSKSEYRKLSGWDNDKIHVVYAGTFDPRKGGALAAVKAGEFLNDKYHLHIIGFGEAEHKNNLVAEIERVASLSDCKISYDGLLSGDDYIKYIQACDIGLSTQNPLAGFNDTSFPSKILSYMANGLKVVSVRIPVVVGSAIGDQVIYYDEQTPEKIAKAIKKVELKNNSDSRDIIEKLDLRFVKEISEMLQK